MAESQKFDTKSFHPYNDDHPLVGVPCLFDGEPAVPYGSYEVDDGPGTPKRRLLAVAILDDRGSGIAIGLSGIEADSPKLVPVDRNTFQGRRIYHEVVNGLLKAVILAAK